MTEQNSTFTKIIIVPRVFFFVLLWESFLRLDPVRCDTELGLRAAPWSWGRPQDSMNTVVPCEIKMVHSSRGQGGVHTERPLVCCTSSHHHYNGNGALKHHLCAVVDRSWRCCWCPRLSASRATRSSETQTNSALQNFSQPSRKGSTFRTGVDLGYGRVCCVCVLTAWPTVLQFLTLQGPSVAVLWSHALLTRSMKCGTLRRFRTPWRALQSLTSRMDTRLGQCGRIFHQVRVLYPRFRGPLGCK